MPETDKSPEAQGPNRGAENALQLDPSRREFLNKGLSVTGWGLVMTLGVAGAVETVRFFSPSVVFRPPSTFEVGKLEDFASQAPPDERGIILVEPKWKDAHRFFILREPARLSALFARCTHLGCTVNWFPGLNIFKCPCHGSQFHSDGVNFAGPAPRALDLLRISMDNEGNIIVDTSVVYPREDHSKPGAYIEI